MPQATIRNLRKEFGDLVAVTDFDLTIEENEFVTLVGPSGCGKTTTLRMIAGLETPTSGTVMFGDEEVTHLRPQQRNIALLFQDIALYPHMSVRENMGFGLKISGVDKTERDRKVEETAEMLQISELLNESPSNLSGGQQQRVALGRSIVRDPDMFLFDEPMSDLDAKLKRDLRPLFEEVTRDIGCPTLYVTHDQEEAMSMSDRIVVMNDGEIEQIGTPTEIYSEPASKFTGGFIGQPTMQFFEGTVREEGGTLVGDIGEYEFDVDAAVPSSHVGGDVEFGVRPQHIDVEEADATSTDGISAEHVLDEPLGNVTHSFFDTGFGRLVVELGPSFTGEQKQYRLVFDPAEVNVFDSADGQRVSGTEPDAEPRPNPESA